MKYVFLHQHLLSSVVFFHSDLSVIICSYNQLAITKFLNAKGRITQTISSNVISMVMPKSAFQKQQYLQADKHFYFGFLDDTHLSKKRRKALLLTTTASSEALKKALFCFFQQSPPSLLCFGHAHSFHFPPSQRFFFQWKHKTCVYVMHLSHDCDTLQQMTAKHFPRSDIATRLKIT